MNTAYPTAAVLVIGNEILSGRTADANLNCIARRLTDVGIQLMECRVVKDVPANIVGALNDLRGTYTYVFTTGGIGPTHDDMTTDCVAKAFGVAVERNAQVAEMLKASRGARCNEETLRMANFPIGARLIPTPEPTPPGYTMGNVHVLAGVPQVMQVMLEGVLPLLEKGVAIHTLSIDAMVSESLISRPFAEVQDAFPALELGSYPFKAGQRYGTSLVVKGTDRPLVEQAFAQVKQVLNQLGAEVRI
ncbi:MAG: molybdopterin-binding protein [Alphaproteobacteria bacterium]